MTFPKLKQMVEENNNRRKRDAQRWEDLDQDACMLCEAAGPDMRSLFLACGYLISEVVPEAIDLVDCPEGVSNRGWYLKICKSCRGAFLSMLADWKTKRIHRRGVAKNSDGGDAVYDDDANIPVRVNGETVMMTFNEFADHRTGG